MKILSTFVLLCIINHSASGQTPGIVNFVDDSWKNVNFYKGKMLIKKTVGNQPNEDLVTSINWQEDIKGNFFTHFTSSRFGQPSLDFTESYDGSTYSALDRSGSSSACKISKALPAAVKTFEFGLFPLEPFRFLTKTVTNNNIIRPNLHDIVASFDNAMLAASANKLSETLFKGKPSLSFEIDGGSDVSYNKKIKYHVFLSKDSHQLLGWQCVSPNDQLNSELEVTKWKSPNLNSINSRFSYPSDFTVRYFNDSEPTGQPTPTFEYSISFDLTGVSNQSDTTVFSIDPTEADYIYDLDNKVLIKNPR